VGFTAGLKAKQGVAPDVWFALLIRIPDRKRSGQYSTGRSLSKSIQPEAYGVGPPPPPGATVPPPEMVSLMMDGGDEDQQLGIRNGYVLGLEELADQRKLTKHRNLRMDVWSFLEISPPIRHRFAIANSAVHRDGLRRDNRKQSFHPDRSPCLQCR